MVLLVYFGILLMMNMLFLKLREFFFSLRILWIWIVVGWGVVLENGGFMILIVDFFVCDVIGLME